MVYLRVTAEGCGDNGQALNDALDAPKVNPLNPGARDNAVAQRRQHYLQHRQQKQQWDREEQTMGAEEERRWVRRARGRAEGDGGGKVEQGAERNRMKGGRGRREDTSLLEGLGVWTGLGLDL